MITHQHQQQHPFASKLTTEDAERIRAEHAAGVPVRELMRRYRVARASIYAVLRGRSHPRRVVVELGAESFHRLVDASRAEGRAPESLAAELIARGLTGPTALTTTAAPALASP